MKPFLPTKLSNLSLSVPLFAVGGCVRNALLGKEKSDDIDLAAAVSLAEFREAALRAGFTIKAEYPRTGTLLFSDESGVALEFTSFRRERYREGGAHAPVAIERTADLTEDARRRDFTANAIYFDVKESRFVDPLNGREAVKQKSLVCCRAPEDVFREDGLRLLRLCRFAAELGFAPSPETEAGARLYCENICDISAERIYAELTKILAAPEKYEFSPADGAEQGLRLAERIGILGILFPALAAGRGLAKRFHRYDMLDHSFRAVYYAHPDVRLAALFHDVGKPACYAETGRFYGHADVGAVLTKQILESLKAPARVVEETSRLVALHMTDYDGTMRENKLRRVIRDEADIFDLLIKLMQADYSARRDDRSPSPTVLRLTEVRRAMERDGVPFTPRELALTGKDLEDLGYRGSRIGEEIARLMNYTLMHPFANTKECLLKRATEDLK